MGDQMITKDDINSIIQYSSRFIEYQGLQGRDCSCLRAERDSIITQFHQENINTDEFMEKMKEFINGRRRSVFYDFFGF